MIPEFFLVCHGIMIQTVTEQLHPDYGEIIEFKKDSQTLNVKNDTKICLCIVSFYLNSEQAHKISSVYIKNSQLYKLFTLLYLLSLYKTHTTFSFMPGNGKFVSIIL